MTIELKKDTKRKLFQVAAELFSRDGYYKVSVREICEAAGVTKPVLYYYFKDKENLLFEMIKETRITVNQLVEKYIINETKFVDQLEGVIKLYIEFINDHSHFVQLSTFIQFMAAPEKVKQYKYDTTREDWEKITRLFLLAQKNGELKQGIEPLLLAKNFIGSIIIILSSYMMNHINAEQFNKELYEILEFWKQEFVIEKN